MLRTGTMGWAYDDWVGPFYAPGAQRESWLRAFAGVFDTVEIDATFHAAPRPEVLAGWARQTPPTFRFTAKVPRALTHERGLIAAERDALAFAELLTDSLDGRLGALLVQMPPDFTAAEVRTLAAFVKGVGKRGIPWTIELRHASWLGENLPERLAPFSVALATTEKFDAGGPLRYVRLLGAEKSVERFHERAFDRSAELDDWAGRLRATEGDVFVFARNYFEGHAPATLIALRERLGLTTPQPPGAQQLSLFG